MHRSITLQQEAEYVEQEKNTCTIQVSKESFIVHDGKLMSGDIADDVSYTDDNKQQCIHQARHNKQWCPINEKRKL